MANHKSAEKSNRQAITRTARNRDRMSRIRSYLRNVETAISNADQNAAKEALRAAQPELMRGVTKGLFKKNTASRKISRLSQRIKALAS